MNLRRLSLRLVCFGNGDAFDPRKFQPVVNNPLFCKPHGGLWTSPVGAAWGWEAWCRENGFGNLASRFECSFSGITCCIDSITDMEMLPWLGDGLRAVPDFEAMVAMGVDATWLTARGEAETRLAFSRNLYGWDCETVFIMNPASVAPVEP